MMGKNQKERRGVLLCGAYGRGNIGDESILLETVRRLRAHDPALPICVVSKTPKQTASRYQVEAVHTYDAPGWLRRMRRAALYLSGGGSLIQDATSTRSLLYYLFQIRAAKSRGCAVMLYGCGIGPVKEEKNRRRAGRCLERCVDLAALRDADSVRALEKLGVTRPRVVLTADPALLLPAREPEAARNELMLALRPWAGIEEKLPLLAAALDRACEQSGCAPVLFALEPETDRPVLERVRELLHRPAKLVEAPQDPEALTALFARMRAVVSMRLHPLIFAAAQGVPVAGIVYDPKVRGFLSELGSDACRTIGELNEKTARELFDRALTDTPNCGRIETLRSRAAQNAALAIELLRGREVEQ